MARPRTHRVVALAAVVAACGAIALASAAATDDFKIIVNPGNPVDAIERTFLRDAFLRKASDWDGGVAIRPIDLATRFGVRMRFGQAVLRKTPAQLKNYWNQQIFSGKGVPPPEVDSIAAVVAYVLGNPGAIGYLPVDADVGAAKVVRVK
jgi:ABC-type phosphate transport system substrate-binding protein